MRLQQRVYLTFSPALPKHEKTREHGTAVKGNVKKPLFLAVKCSWSLREGAEEGRGLSGCLPLPEEHFSWEMSTAVRQLSVHGNNWAAWRDTSPNPTASGSATCRGSEAGWDADGRQSQPV